MKIAGAIFDLDGTLLDSMGAWHDLGTNYLRGRGYVPPATIHQDLLRLSMLQAAHYMKELGVRDDEQKIYDDMCAMIAEFYGRRVQAKPGALALLQRLDAMGVKMCVATATDRPLVEAGMRRAGMERYISRVFTCKELNTTKHEPLIFETARGFLGTVPEETWVFEDARHCAVTAAGAGLRVCGVYDPSEPDQDALKAASDVYVRTFEEALAIFGGEEA